MKIDFILLENVSELYKNVFNIKDLIQNKKNIKNIIILKILYEKHEFQKVVLIVSTIFNQKITINFVILI